MKLCLVVLMFYCIGHFHALRLENSKSEAMIVNLIYKLFDCDFRKNLHLDASRILVYFYDFQNQSVNGTTEPKMFNISEASRKILAIKDFDKTKNLYIYFGGYTSEITSNSTERIKKAFRHVPNSYLIIIDFLVYANDKPNNKFGYERAIRYSYYIGLETARFLSKLMYQGAMSPKKIHGIGYSLGCQILGYMGDSFLKITGQKIGRITAIDPSGPCFSSNSIEEVKSGNAEYVEIYHCNFGGLGTTNIMGDIDFFVNKGTTQPTCESPVVPVIDFPMSAICNHYACLQSWTSSVVYQDRFTAYKCDSYKHFVSGKCSSNNKTTGGFRNPGTATGIYYFSTLGLSDDI